jgi:hypothetical protein
MNLLEAVAAAGGEQQGVQQSGLRSCDIAVECGVAEAAWEDYPHLQGFGLYSPFPAAPGQSEAKVWRLRLPVGYGECDGKKEDYTPRINPDVAGKRHHIWLIDDAGLDFRHRQSAGAWPAALRGQEGPTPDWIIVKMSAPLASGDLWQTIVAGQFQDTRLPADSLASRSIVVVSAEDVRCESAVISRGVSWERTALDLAKAVRENPVLRELTACRYLIVMFGAEGAVLVDCRERGRPHCHLVFDPSHCEGDWTGRIEGDVFGRMSSFVAGITAGLAKTLAPSAAEGHAKEDAEIDSLLAGIGAGLAGARRLLLCGHGAEGSDPSLPLAEVAKEILAPQFRFEQTQVPEGTATGIAGPGTWRILEGNPARRSGLGALTRGRARLVAQFGLKTLSGVPYLRFGDLRTVDRGEIESLRNIRTLIEQYRQNPNPGRPLSIAVFGQPGSGKSFGVKQIAKAVFGDKVPILDFNLSQLSIRDDSVLIGAFHQVRDKVLKGATPVVFWDEFDSVQLQWLARLLAPMQDGTFLEGQMVRPVGKCVFVFAGGTSYDFASFGPPALTEQERSRLAPEDAKGLLGEQQFFKGRKGPDFKSRLAAYLNVAGPNQRQIRCRLQKHYEPDPTDTGYPLRRALLLRSQFGLQDDEKLDIDAGLLSAFLEIGEYRHGARSMDKIIEHVKTRSRGGRVRPSHLPPDELLDLYVDAAEFYRLLEPDLEFQQMAEAVAAAIHHAFLEDRNKEQTPVASHLRRTFYELRPDDREQNLAAARRMPEVLSIADLTLVRQAAGSQDCGSEVARRIEETLEEMAEAEHNGWMEHRFRNDWRYAPIRDDRQKLQDCLLPYSQLPEHQKEKDRQQVRRYPEFAAIAGYRIVPRNQT